MTHQPQQAARFAYRADIDGLRAVAVLLVVLDHLKTHFTGGYIGVDVFFVISGYLISSTILAEMATGTFSIINFYERRVRRILPALLVMMLCASLLAYRFFVPSEFEAFARSLLAALFSVSNFLFWHQAGYFDAPSGLKPLLHTWSLAVEEQFYILFPIFLIAVRNSFPRRLKAILWTLTAISFALAAILVRRAPNATFYFAPLRAWELLIGTIVSQRYVPAIHGKVLRNLASLAGILLILVPSLIYTANTRFPGLAALPPCIGAALVIAAGESGPSLTGSLLGWRPVAFIGLISYSLYLWHWPILVFQNIASPIFLSEPSGRLTKFAILAASLVVATLSWRFVETPFRSGRFRLRRAPLFAASGIAIAILTFVGLWIISYHGMSSRFPAEALEVSRYITYDRTSAYRENVCFISPNSAFADFRPAVCLADDPTRKQLLLLGDSHAAALYPGIASNFPELNISQANTAACEPFVTQPARATVDCKKMSAYIYGDYLLHHHVATVLLAGRWQEQDIPELGRSVAWIAQHGMEPIVIGPAIEYNVPLPGIVAISLRDHDLAALERHRMIAPQQLDKRLGDVVRNQWKVRYISIYENLCAGRSDTGATAELGRSSDCPVYAAPGVPLLFDSDHLTADGSMLYAKSMRTRNQLP